MNQDTILSDLINSMHTMEASSVHLTEIWLNGKPERPNDVEQIHVNHQTMIESLHALSNLLQEKLLNLDSTSEQVPSLSYAYELTQELIQSRESCKSLIELLQNGKNPQYPEFYRALFIKEQAAAEQINLLAKCFKPLH